MSVDVDALERRLKQLRPFMVSGDFYAEKLLLTDMLAALRESEHMLAVVAIGAAESNEDNATLRAERDRLREAIEKMYQRISNSRKGSIGSIDSHYVGVQIGIEELEKWKRQALEPTKRSTKDE